MIIFQHLKGKAKQKPNQDKPKQTEHKQSKKSAISIQPTVDGMGYESLSANLKEKYKDLTMINQYSNDYLQTIEKTKKHMNLQIQIMSNQKAQILNPLIEQFQRFANQELTHQNKEVENFYSEMNHQSSEKILTLLQKIKINNQKKAKSLSNLKIYQNFERQLKQIQGSLHQKISHLRQELKEKQTAIQQLKDIQSDLEKKAQIIFEEKKIDNNFLQQTKGNVRVYCRLRPCESQSEQLDYEVNQNFIKIKKNKKDLKSHNSVSQWDYLFEKVFDKDVTQESLFNQLTQLVQCSLDGHNVCIFAYGQTGSGKTFTMNGSLEQDTSHLRGFTPRSIEYIFDQVQIAKTKGYSCKLFISVSQIYKDKQRDLLSIYKNQSKNENKFISRQGNIKSVISSLPQVDVQYSEIKNVVETIYLLKETLKARTTANTLMNVQSSRSHLIFEIKFQIQHIQKNKKRTSSLVLVDLAGSERRKDAGDSLQRQQQGASINNSLTNLGNVIRAIKEGVMPPFRSNVLTMALQRYLDGDSKVVMFVNVSTERSNLEQTINSLNFADQARSCQIKKEERKGASLQGRSIKNSVDDI